jgi:D-alanine transaminase
VLIDVIKAQGLEFEERPFTVEEAYGAREAFLTSASQIVMPVVRIDDRPVGNGAPGSVAVALRAEFHRHAEWSLGMPLPRAGHRLLPTCACAVRGRAL